MSTQVMCISVNFRVIDESNNMLQNRHDMIKTSQSENLARVLKLEQEKVL